MQLQSSKQHVPGAAIPTLQVQIYFPELGHPAFGVVRAIVKDSSDAADASSQTFLDSDGKARMRTTATAPPLAPAAESALAAVTAVQRASSRHLCTSEWR
jgi:hypothetical protein